MKRACTDHKVVEHRGKKSKILFNEIEKEILRDAVINRPTIYLDELARYMYEATGKFADTGTMSRELSRAKITNKKIVQMHSGRAAENKAIFAEHIKDIGYHEIIFIDETASSDRKYLRTRGWGPEGRRVRVRLPKVSGKRYSLMGSMSYLGVGPHRLYEGSVNRERFLEYVENELLPTMYPHWNQNGTRTNLAASVIVLDNCSTHR